MGKDYVLLGVGNRSRGDDGVGCLVAESLKSPDWLSIDSGSVPENYLEVIRKEDPRYLVIVDAADMGLDPGEFRIIPRSRIDSFHPSTHIMSLSYLVEYLEESVGEIILVGVQPKERRAFDTVTEPLQQATRKIARLLEEKRLGSIKPI